jgi:hypothetical protein
MKGPEMLVTIAAQPGSTGAASEDGTAAGPDATLLSPTAMAVSRGFFAILGVVGLLLTYAGWFTNPRAAEPATSPATA